MWWAILDRTIDLCLQPLIRLTPSQTASLVTSIENISARCDVVKRLALLESPNADWTAWFVQLLERVSGEIAPLRNRYVHDDWNLNDPIKPLKINKRAYVAKAGAHQQKTVSFGQTEHVSTEKVEKLTLRIAALYDALNVAVQNLVDWRRTGSPLQVDPIWLPVSMPRSREMTLQETFEAQKHTPFPDRFVIDPD